jgi:hypothetical protein
MPAERGIVNRAGRFGDLKKAGKAGEVAHHMPQKAARITSKNDGPALGMTIEDHQKTRTFAGRGKRTIKEDAHLSPRRRLALDVWDVRTKFRSKYRRGSLDIIRHAKARKEFRKK